MEVTSDIQRGREENIDGEEQEEVGKNFNPHSNKKVMSIKEQQEYVVSSLPNIGPLIAKELLEKFDSVKAVVNASEEELKDVDKVGKIKAKQIHDIVTRKYKQDF